MQYPLRSRTDFMKWMVVILGLCHPAFADDQGLMEEQAMQSAVERVASSVVQIQTLGGAEAIDGQLVSQGPTTGLVVDPDGFILSSAIQFAQMPSSILVTLPSGVQRPAKIVARDRLRMLVLLKIDVDEPLVVPEFVPRQEIRVGQRAIAVGRALDWNEPSMSAGIVSAVNRIWGRAIQTDAKVSPLCYGGPLLDIHGRVLGILVPLSPDSDAVSAGAELYDSGLAFAVPMADLLPDSLTRMQQGEDLVPGLLGIHLKGQNIYTERAIIGFCPPKTPARDAGLRAGDEIIGIDDVPISRQVHLRHAMGRKTAGESVRVRVRRESREFDLELSLVDKVEPYELPFLGVLLARNADENRATEVAYVYPKSPAEQAGIQSGDHLRTLDQRELSDASGWREALAVLEPGAQVTITWERQGKEQSATTRLDRQPSVVPDNLPGRGPERRDSSDNKSVPGRDPEWQNIRLADEPNECWVWDPFQDGSPRGLIVWILPPGQIDRAELLATWSTACRQRGFILAVPRPQSESGWELGELETIRRLMETICANYSVDPARVTVGGYQNGGSVAMAFAFTHRERVRGVAAVDAVMPPRMAVRGNDPELRLEFWLRSYTASKLRSRMLKDIESLQEMKYPIITEEGEGAVVSPDPSMAQRFVRWADSLDRM